MDYVVPGLRAKESPRKTVGKNSDHLGQAFVDLADLEALDLGR